MHKNALILFPIIFFFSLLLAIFALAPHITAQADPAVEAKIAPGVQATLDDLPESQMTTVIVTLVDQVDKKQFKNQKGPERQKAAVKALKDKATRSQKEIVKFLDGAQKQGEVENYDSFWVLNGLSVTASPGVIHTLAARADVLKITADAITVAPTYAQAEPPAEPNLALVQAPALWQSGFYGQGVVVANMDSGVDLNHPDLSSNWRGGSNSWFDPYGQNPAPADLTGHGTGTMGVMVGGANGGSAIGIAPQAQWIAVKIFNNSGSATATAIHQGFQWLMDPDGDTNTADAPDVVNNSWTMGNPGCDLEFELDLSSLLAAGIVPVFAAGNFGPGADTSASPANNPSALAIGGVNNSDLIMNDSSRGPTTCGQAITGFPDLVAPGANIRTSQRFGLYTTASGTSLAAPHVAGGLALLLSAFPDVPPEMQKTALLNGAIDLGPVGQDDSYGNGRLDLLAAYQWLQDNPAPPTPSATPTDTPPPPTATPAPNINLALNRPVTVSSLEDNAHSGSNAVDGDLGTWWQTARAKGKNKLPTEWLTIDLGADVLVGQVVLAWDSNFATGYNLQLSSDGSNWSIVYGTTACDGGTDTISFAQLTARYFKLESSAWSSGSLRNWLREVEIYRGSGDPPPSPTSTPSPTPTTTSPTATPLPSPTSTPGSESVVHGADLDDFSSLSGRKFWNASVDVLVHDAAHLPVSGATVDGSWSNGASGSAVCTTGSNGRCSLTKSKISTNTAGVSLTIDTISGANFSYSAAANHDPDGDSSGTQIILPKP